MKYSTTCLNCQTSFRLERGDEIPKRKCASPSCTAELCPCCSTFNCDGCAGTFCSDHAIIEEPQYVCRCIQVDVDRNDATWCFDHNPEIRPKPAKFCSACMDESQVEEWPIIPKLEPIRAKVMMLSAGWTGDGAA